MAALSLPPDWLVFGENELADAGTRAALGRDFGGASGLFGAIAAQGSRVRLVFLGVDPAARGASTLAPTVAVVAVEPRVPGIGLDLAADFVLDALDGALSVETEVERERAELPVGEAVRFGFEHRVVDDAVGPGLRAALDGALVTTDAASFLVLHNIDADAETPARPTLEEVLTTLRVLP